METKQLFTVLRQLVPEFQNALTEKLCASRRVPIYRNINMYGKFQRIECGCSKSLSPIQNILITRSYGRHTTVSGVSQNLNPSEAAKRKLAGKKPEPEKILLLTGTDQMSITFLDAEKLAKKRGMQLVEVKEMEIKLHSEKKVYKFDTISHNFSDDSKTQGTSGDNVDDEVESATVTGGSHEYGKGRESNPKRKKEDKTILLKSKISAHDIQAKVKQMNKLLEKEVPIRVFIGGAGSSGDPEFVFKEIEKQLIRSSKIHQKKVTSSEIKFHILPMSGEDNAAGLGEPGQKIEKGKKSKTSQSDDVETQS